MADYQPSLLSQQDLRAAEVSWAYNQGVNREPPLSAIALQNWKQRIQGFQAGVGTAPASSQGSLFDKGCADLEGSTSPADEIDPFGLPQRNAEFWREQFHGAGESALYFVVDQGASLLLYVGETVKANQRWKGTHDCKRYILSYIEAHRTHGLRVEVNIGFWPHAPVERQPRQALESELIYKWRSPFNKQNWRFWGTPFVGQPLSEA
ncbi:MAG: GIY-YIG nuclease family protein [Cyanobacteria bacterium]|nr:GIY-YIG nuclease family protein [Cyanobacteriota bacterium]MDA0865067.1 GIY-YIG nuclease family protein [Cyanobacteriota bacterium]